MKPASSGDGPHAVGIAELESARDEIIRQLSDLEADVCPTLSLLPDDAAHTIVAQREQLTQSVEKLSSIIAALATQPQE